MLLMISWMAWPRITNAQDNPKPCPAGKTCIKKSTRDSCIRCFADVQKQKRDHKIKMEAAKKKCKADQEGCQKKIANMEKRITNVTTSLEKGCRKDKRAAFINGIFWGAGAVVVIAGVTTLIVVIYHFANSAAAASSKSLTIHPVSQGVYHDVFTPVR